MNGRFTPLMDNMLACVMDKMEEPGLHLVWLGENIEALDVRR